MTTPMQLQPKTPRGRHKAHTGMQENSGVIFFFIDNAIFRVLGWTSHRTGGIDISWGCHRGHKGRVGKHASIGPTMGLSVAI